MNQINSEEHYSDISDLIVSENYNFIQDLTQKQKKDLLKIQKDLLDSIKDNNFPEGLNLEALEKYGEKIKEEIGIERQPLERFEVGNDEMSLSKSYLNNVIEARENQNKTSLFSDEFKEAELEKRTAIEKYTIEIEELKAKRAEVSSLSLEEKFEKVVEKISNEDGHTSASYLADLMVDLSKEEMPDNKISDVNLIEDFNNLMMADHLRQSNSDILEKYIEEKYNKEISRIEDFKLIKKQRELTEGESETYKGMVENLQNPLSEEKELMTHREYHQLHAANPKLMNVMRELHPEEMKPIVEKVENQNQEEYEKKAIDAGLDPKGERDPVIYKQAVFESFDKQMGKSLTQKVGQSLGEAIKSQYDSPLKKVLLLPKLAFAGPALGVGLAAQTALGVFMKTEAGQKIGKDIGDKFSKIFPKDETKPKSKLGAIALGSLSVVGVLGLTYAGLGEYLPPEQMAVLDKGLDSVITGISESYVEHAPNFVQESVSTIGSKITGLFSNFGFGGSQTALAETGLDAPVPTFEDYTIKSGDALERIAKNMLPAGTSDSQIMKAALQIAEDNGFPDANNIPKGEVIKLPSDPTTLLSADPTIPKVEFTTLSDISKLDIPYGSSINPDQLTNDIIEKVMNNRPDVSEERLMEFKLGLAETLSQSSTNGIMDSRKALDLAPLMNAHFGANPIELRCSVPIEGTNMCLLKTEIAEASTPDAPQEKTNSPHYDSRGGRYGSNR